LRALSNSCVALLRRTGRKQIQCRRANSFFAIVLIGSNMDNHSLIYLYMYRHRTNGKAYIGVTSDLRRRLRVHAQGKSNAIAFNCAVKKHGIENFNFRVLAVFDDVDAANYHEHAAIFAFETLSPKGYNLIGGAPKTEYHGPMSQEVKDKISEANKDRVVSIQTRIKLSENAREQWQRETSEQRANRLRKHSKNMKGHIVSTETRAKISKANKGNTNFLGKKHTLETLEKMSAVQKSKVISPEQREKISRALTGKKPSAETRLKLSVSIQEWWARRKAEASNG
jgi:group I intron endonuclease